MRHTYRIHYVDGIGFNAKLVEADSMVSAIEYVSGLDSCKRVLACEVVED